MALVKHDARGLSFRELNERLHRLVADGIDIIDLVNVNGHRYIGTGLAKPVRLNIYGTPGSDLGAFMDGPEIRVNGSGQDAIGNTMNSGAIIINGDAGNVLGLSMRGGKIFVRGNVGHRVGIHIKAFAEQVPRIIVGGVAGDFFGEYMAGGRMILLGLDRRAGQPVVGDYVGTGMHGGTIYIRGKVEEHQLGKEVGLVEMTEEDYAVLQEDLAEFTACFNLSLPEIMREPFAKLVPLSHRPYGQLYVY
ncbi:MAG: hypothetical protein M1299_11485 [Firmicutes bacterium]|nr:hypothetical protein [Bacillota bacterium]